MGITHRLLKLRILLIVLLLPLCTSCSGHMSFLKSENQPPTEEVISEEAVSVQSSVPLEEEVVAPARIEEEREIAAPIENEEEQEIAALPQSGEEKKEDNPLPLSEVPENNPLPPSPQPQKKSDQEMLDSALEFCQTANYFWERGELDNALNALDQSYSLILKVNPEDGAEILQQRDDLRFTISKRIIEVYTSRFTVANGYEKPIPLVMNRYVERALSLYKGRDRQFFIDAYLRSGRYRPAIVSALRDAGLPEELSWLPLIESGFKIRALSRARALGLWQFIASTGYKFGLTRDQWVDERMDPEKSTQAAIAYLKELHQIFGDWATVLAAYNCGEGRVLRCIRTQKINYLDNFWDLYSRLPVETVFYVPKFMAVLHILSDPEAHGFDLPPVQEEIETEQVTFDKQVHLRTVSKHLQVPYVVLQDLNPALRRNCTPSRPYALRVPSGKGAVLLSELDDIPVYRPPVPAYVVHRVRKGECLSLIARRYRTSVSAIMALNGLKSRSYIKVGWRLKIPTRRTYASLRKASFPAPSRPQIKGRAIEYVVRKGDSLWKIANRFATTTEAIQSLNNLNTTRLDIGQVLLIPQEATDFTGIKTGPDAVCPSISSA
ncbi:MAG: LysM peptidoglycan-binding domain-containing protein [Deltaproteobacteria bacterium]|nr:MAG: LysM peptidoglycan-binding domain-containing protein [Deltaproteobacteria bacterium]